MSTVKANRLEQVSNTNLPVNLLPVTASAWVNFDGTGVPAIRENHNVESITDNGTGQYTINFAENLANADYAVSCSAGGISGPRIQMQNYFVSSISMILTNTSEAPSDASRINVTVFGGQS